MENNTWARVDMEFPFESAGELVLVIRRELPVGRIHQLPICNANLTVELKIHLNFKF